MGASHSGLDWSYHDGFKLISIMVGGTYLRTIDKIIHSVSNENPRKILVCFPTYSETVYSLSVFYRKSQLILTSCVAVMSDIPAWEDPAVGQSL